MYKRQEEIGSLSINIISSSTESTQIVLIVLRRVMLRLRQIKDVLRLISRIFDDIPLLRVISNITPRHVSERLCRLRIMTANANMFLARIDL